MKKLFFLSVILLLNYSLLFSQVAINNNGNPPDSSAGLDVSYSNKGFLLPRMTFEQRNGIIKPAEGLMVFCTNCSVDGKGVLSIFQGGGWKIVDLGCYVPKTPLSGIHSPSGNEIVWRWNKVPIALGYMWDTINDYSDAINLGTDTTYTETGLDCNTSYTRYVWAHNECGTSLVSELTQLTSLVPIDDAPTEGIHVSTATTITWKWNTVENATGYKWNTTNVYSTATDMGLKTDTTETGLACDSTYTRYVWAYNGCGVSITPTPLTFATSIDPPDPPVASIHEPSSTQIVWNWNVVDGATGYKWNKTDDYGTAQDRGTATDTIETGLTCNTFYTRYVWAYNECAVSSSTMLTQTTSLDPPDAPTPGIHVPSSYQIVWNWNIVDEATGYKWNTTDDYGTAIDRGMETDTTETGLTCDSSYIRYVWAYNNCGVSISTLLTQATSLDPPAAPDEKPHFSSATSITWNWNTVADATGYKWNTTDDYGTATDRGMATDTTETGLTCNSLYTRYVWAYSNCGVSQSTQLTQTTSLDPPDAPTAATHDASSYQIVWKWNIVDDATGYKWNTTNNYGTAIDRGTATEITETGLTCDSAYSRYVWAYSNCGVSQPTLLTQSTTLDPPNAPTSGTHIPSPTQILWRWNEVPDATGYKWNLTDDYGTATDRGLATDTTETGLTCDSSYTRYVWAYSNCGVSQSATLTQATSLDPPDSPTSGTHVPSITEIVWNWNTVAEATGYRWNTTDDYGTATDMGLATDTTETGLTCDSSYTRYVWAYNNCGVSTPTPLMQATSPDPPDAPTSGTHEPSPTQIVWNWTSVAEATGYKWNNNNNYNTAIDRGTSTNATETGLTCNTLYTSYVWAYNSCGVSISTSLTQTTSLDPPDAPGSGNHIPSATQIVWNWNTVTGATGYKWNTTDDYGTAIDRGMETDTTETGLTCDSSYTRYVWAYNNCGVSQSTQLSQATTLDPPDAPTAATHVPSAYQIVWNWNTVTDAAGYKWNTTNDYGTATDRGLATDTTETGLTCDSSYTRYVWAYNDCGVSQPAQLTQTTSLDPPAAPDAASHFSSATSITWNWNTVEEATGYKWNTTNDYATATDRGLATYTTETGLTCDSSYTRYVWAYGNCGVSQSTQLTQATSLDPPDAPGSGTHIPSATQIVWNWNTVDDATGYKWNTTDNYNTATDLGEETDTTETGLSCDISYTRYVWAYGDCGVSESTELTQLTTSDPPADPVAGTHIPSSAQIIWKWNSVDGATGYKWGTTNVYTSATDVGLATDTTETGLDCNIVYTRYVWAYNECANSSATTLTQTTSLYPPEAPEAGTHVPSATQIVWNWIAVPDADGYKWNTTNSYGTATDMGILTTKTEINLICGTGYTCYVWAYNNCGVSTSTQLTQTTSFDPPASPAPGNHVPNFTEIIWNWNTVAGAAGYKWGITNVYANATDMGTLTTKTEINLECATNYTRYAWAYNSCGVSTPVTLNQTTLSCWSCGTSITINHVADSVAPVTKTVTYGTVTNVPGETTKCWTTSNLGSDHQATTYNDNTEASAGWYWQFNKARGFMHDGTTRTPATPWITAIVQYSNWTPINDPCALEFGGTWRIPTKLEWEHADVTGGWGTYLGPWNSLLKLHEAGYLYSSDGSIRSRGSNGVYWSSTQSAEELGWRLNFSSSLCVTSTASKTFGYTLRCIKN